MRARTVAIGTAALLITGVVVSGVASAQVRAYAPPSVITATATATSAPSPSARTCAAFKAWDAHRTAANLDVLMTDSELAPWKYLGDDVAQLYSGVRENDAKYVAYGVRYVGQDCRVYAIQPGGPIKPAPAPAPALKV